MSLLASLRSAILSLTLISGGAVAYAQTDTIRPESRFAFGVELGRMSALETYLSPVTYSGLEMGFHIGQELPMRMGDGMWRMRYGGRAVFGSLLNPRGNARKYEFGATLGWGMEHLWSLGHGISLWAGGAARFDAGAGYVPRNSNNPAAVRAMVSLEATAGAQWRGRLGRVPLIIGDRIGIPVAGLLFSPQYGESYYEIYLGNRSDLVHFGWWGNIMGVSNQLAVTLPTRPWSVTLSWNCRLDRQRVCNLRTRLLTNSLGVTLSR